MIHTTDFIATFGVKTKWKHLMAEQKVYVPTVGEEVANAVSHGVMLCLTLAALPFAAVRAYVHDGTLAAVAASVFVISLLLMFLGSTLYHSMHPASRHKEVFHILDHIFIYVAIAGTYTPIALSVIGGWQGTFITVLQWAMVLFGIIYKSLARRSIPAVSLTIYLVMGWTIVFFMPLFVRHASMPLLVLIAAGGVLYTAGAWSTPAKGSAITTWYGTCSSIWRRSATSRPSSSTSTEILIRAILRDVSCRTAGKNGEKTKVKFALRNPYLCVNSARIT